MMLTALVAYAERENLGDPDFAPGDISWVIPLSRSGARLGPPIDLTTQPQKRPLPFLEQDQLTVASHPRAKFLCDCLERATGWADPEKPERVVRAAASLAFFSQLLAACASSRPRSKPALDAVATFLANKPALQALYGELASAKAKRNQLATFSVDGQPILEAPDVEAFWRDWRAAHGTAGGGPARPCFATGQLAIPVQTSGNIRGVPGGNPSGTKLLSFDKDAFRSYGLEQALNASVSAAAEAKIRAALEALIAKSRDQKLVFGNSICLHWTRQTADLDPLNLLVTADPDAVAQLLHSAQTGRPPAPLDADDYYAVTLSGNGARIVVRDWLASTVATIERRTAQWFLDLAIADIAAPGVPTRHGFSLYQLLAAMANDKLTDKFQALPHGAFEDLLRAALTGAPLPRALLAASLRREAVERARGEARFIPARFALIKACLLRLPNRKENQSMSATLDANSRDAAYLCGQLFAVLGRLQFIALGRVGASIADRSYGGVATRPATTLAPIFTKVPAYIKKANDRWGGSGTNKQKEIEVLCQHLDALGGLPKTLDLEEQGRFALAYYSQLAAYRARKEEAAIERQAEQIDDSTL